MDNQQSVLIKNKYISINDASDILGISNASIYNWIRHGYLKSVKNLYKIDEVISLKKRIESGELNRLNRYANKSKSKKSFIPLELLKSEKDINIIKGIIDFISINNMDINTCLFYLSLNLLVYEKIIKFNSIETFIKSDFKLTNKKYLSKELLNWFKATVNPTVEYFKLLLLELPRYPDFIGIIYQSLIYEGSKNIQGSYYTPEEIINNISEEYSNNNCLFFDPCCGTGGFLLSFADKTDNPDNLIGFDIDIIAVRIAKINIFIKYKDKDFSPNIYCINSLLSLPKALPLNFKNKKFDVIATNPPWGLHFTKEQLESLKEIYPEIKSEESFSYFLKVCIDLLNENGNLIFVLPESILNIKTHKDIRTYILNNTNIGKIKYLKKRFKNVFTPVIIMELCKNNKSQTIIEYKDNIYNIDSDRFKKNQEMVFDICINNIDNKIITNIYKEPYLGLKNNADWALGIVTGDNKKYLSEKKDGYEPIYRGKDIKQFKLLEPECFINFQKDLYQQVAPEYKYRIKEKLIYKFISNKLVFAFDNNKSLTLNSANILIPKIPDYSLKIIMALFNSSIYQFIFQKKFSTIKVLKNHLEDLPIPFLNIQNKNKIIELVNKILNRKNNYEEIKSLDNFIFHIFNINDKEKEYILNSIL